MRTTGLTLLAALTAAAPAASQRLITPAQFRSTQWLIGQWKGSGGAYPAFYEDYRLLNDSTIRQRSFADSTFTAVSDESDIEFRAGNVRKLRNGAARSVVSRITGDTVRFEPASGPRGGFTWIRKSSDEWVAILDPATPGGEPVTYRLRRLGR